MAMITAGGRENNTLALLLVHNPAECMGQPLWDA